MKKWIIGIVIVLTLVLLGFIQFSRLGGFNEIKLESLASFDLRLQGVAYRGTPQDDGLAQAFDDVVKFASEKSIPFYTIYTTEPAGKLDTMEVFVGVEIGGVIPDFEIKSFSSSSIILAKIKAHKFVMPGPNKVKSKMIEFSKENKFKHPTVFIDKIISPNEVHVIGIAAQ